MSSEPHSATATNGVVSYLLEFEKPIAKMEQEINRLEAAQAGSGRDFSETVAGIRQQLQTLLRDSYAKLTPWEKVLVARHPRRPLLRDYIRLIAKDFCELHGDKTYGEDRALITGFARIAGRKVMLVGHQKGRDTREKIDVNFGCAHPEGYRKALQKMQLAEKFGVPIVALVDTPGAYPGIGAEERGIARAIAVNLMEMSRMRTPIVACVIGEGGSGGALGIAVADQVAVMEHAYYSVISPEGGAAILWKSAEHAPKAAAALRLTPEQLLQLNLIDAIVPEPLGAAHRDPEGAAKSLETWIGQALQNVCKLKPEALLAARYDRWRKIGDFMTDHVAAESSAARPKTKRAATGRSGGRGSVAATTNA